MDRPYNIVLVSTSLDGRISFGPNRTMFDDMDDFRADKSDVWKEIEDLLNFSHKPQANLLGSNSLARDTDELRKLPKYDGDENLYEDYLPDEVVKKTNLEGWLIVVDGKGRLRSGYRGEEARPMLHLVSNGVDPEYLAYLRRCKIPYLITGEKRVNLKEAFEKIKTKLGVETLIHSSGGKLAGAMLKEGLVDEVNVIVRPQIIGGWNTPTLFESPNLLKDEAPIELKLVSAHVKENGYLWLRYLVSK